MTRWRDAVADLDPVVEFGRVVRAGAELIESHGPTVPLGTTCRVMRRQGDPLLAEVVGFRAGRLLLTPLGEADGIEPDAVVRSAPELRPAPANELLGRVVDGLGRPLDGRPAPAARTEPRPAGGQRTEVHEIFETGVRVIDGLLTCGRGQRIGVFAGAGVGKSSLLTMLLRNADADAVVLGLVGERGREVCRFVEQELDDECRKRTVVVVATSGEPAQLRVRAALLAADLADELRRGGLHVLLGMDSLTRLAMAQREVGLAAGEAPTSKGYPPSVFSLMPRVVEKAGAFTDGSVTAFYSVLVEGDDLADPVADALRGTVDGHFVLSRQLAERGLFPAVDVLQSLSRLMEDLVDGAHVDLARRMRKLLSVHRDTEDLIRVGAYRAGSDPQVDQAVRLAPLHETYVRQTSDQRFSLVDSANALQQVLERAESGSEEATE